MDRGLPYVTWSKPTPSGRLTPDDGATPAGLLNRSDMQLLYMHDVLCAHMTQLESVEFAISLHTIHLTEGYLDSPFTRRGLS